MSEALTDYLASRHNLIDIPDTKTAIQDNLFYRHVYYVLTIPKDFTQSCKKQNCKSYRHKSSGQYKWLLCRQSGQWHGFRKCICFLPSGYSAEDATVMLKEAMTEESHVTMLDQNGYGGNIPMHAHVSVYALHYPVHSMLCHYNDHDVIQQSRSPLTNTMYFHFQPEVQPAACARSAQSSDLPSGFLCTLLPIILYGKTFLADTNLTYYLTNSFMMSLSALSLAFFVSTFTDKEQLDQCSRQCGQPGMSFLCGVFVSMDVLGKSVQKIAQFLPVYWYEVANNLLKSHNTFSGTQIHTLYTCYGIQLLLRPRILKSRPHCRPYEKTNCLVGDSFYCWIIKKRCYTIFILQMI